MVTASRSPSGSADRNTRPSCCPNPRAGVAPHPGARIETSRPPGWCRSSPRSLPIRERGSKRGGLRPFHRLHESLPIRERGSKPIPENILLGHAAVAPHPGARIETMPLARSVPRRVVAPHPGARIETCGGATDLARAAGRSPSGSADRNDYITEKNGHKDVAPHPGARIETAKSARPAPVVSCRSPSGSADRNWPTPRGRFRGRTSLPIRERGSKPDRSLPMTGDHPRRSPSGSADRNWDLQLITAKEETVAPHPGARIETPSEPPPDPTRRLSLPIRERGSKQRVREDVIREGRVAPHPGARIETDAPPAFVRKHLRRSPSGSADRNLDHSPEVTGTDSRSPSGSADRNLVKAMAALVITRRSPSGSADRNRKLKMEV